MSTASLGSLSLGTWNSPVALYFSPKLIALPGHKLTIDLGPAVWFFLQCIPITKLLLPLVSRVHCSFFAKLSQTFPKWVKFEAWHPSCCMASEQLDDPLSVESKSIPSCAYPQTSILSHSCLHCNLESWPKDTEVRSWTRARSRLRRSCPICMSMRSLMRTRPSTRKFSELSVISKSSKGSNCYYLVRPGMQQLT